MKAKEKAWQLYSNYFDIIENGKQEGELVDIHMKAINAALLCVDEAITNAPNDILNDFESTGEFYSVKAYYHHVKAELLKLTTNGQNKTSANANG